MASYSWYKFSELTVEQLYSVLKLRADVFVVEQDGVADEKQALGK